MTTERAVSHARSRIIGTAIRWTGFARAARRFELSLVYKRHVIAVAMSRQPDQPVLET
ncbi:MAG: hypothetical protein QGF92_04305 [Gammaproteobacteria bacterium]|nr:hypothetical protein [Gammaproteobacteria bacterium]